MANVLTNLIPDVYAALDVVSRELVGFIPAVARDPRADRVATGQTLRVPITPANVSGTDISPTMGFPTRQDQTIANQTLTITKARSYSFSWTGEEEYAMDQGPGFLTLQQDQIAQSIRALVNEIETDIATAVAKNASRAWGTAGTTPFASNLIDPANVRKILDDNGAPQSDRHMIINTTSGAALRTLAQLTKVNESGDTSMLRQGIILNIHNFDIRESAQVQSLTAGTGASYTVNGAQTVGTTVIPVTGGTGTILAGDFITIGSDPNKYVVTGALSGGNVTIANPGLKVAAANSAAVTVGGNHTANAAFSRNAILLATRLPIVPTTGDLALDRETITDPRSGIALELAAYPGYRMVTYQLLLAWGVSVIKPEHAAILLG